jgi:DNA-binding GntR family transcriptional regulator
MSDIVEKSRSRAYATRAELLREKLTEEIISGELAPGTRLDEQEIANRFGVSRTPVREAVRHLVATGLAESQPHLGATVSGLNTTRLAAYLDAATELEVACERLAALRMDRTEHAELLALHARMGQSLFDDPDRYEELNGQFHELIYVGSHNEVLVEFIRNLRFRISPVYRVQLTLAQTARQSYAEHGRIVSAITSGDAIAAEVAMRAHMLSSALVLERLHGSAIDAMRVHERVAGHDEGKAA